MGQGRDDTHGELYAAYFRAWRDKSNQQGGQDAVGDPAAAALASTTPAALASAASATSATPAVATAGRQTVPAATHNVISLSDIPSFVDIVPILVNDEVEPTFWTFLPAQIDVLHHKGVKVARTIFLSALYEDRHLDKELSSPLTPFEDNPAGYRQRAREIEEKYCAGFGYDGIVIDVDRWLEGEDLSRAAGVFRELAGLYGPLAKVQGPSPVQDLKRSPSFSPNPHGGLDPSSGRGHSQVSGRGSQQVPSPSLLIFDYDILMQPHGLGEEGALLPLVADCISYLFVDSYGLDLTRVESMWEQARPFVRPDQFVPGFSFYEERGERWGDIPADGLPLESSRAWQLAGWEPAGPAPERLSQQDERDHARKGGVFAYAIDRDGFSEGDDELRPTDFAVSRRIKGQVNRNSR